MKILFQGDSITDALRDRSDYHNLSGYTLMVKEALGDKNEYINLGISGNTTQDILNRYETDIKGIAPDVLSLLIGINDIWHGEVFPEKYLEIEQIEKNLEKILKQVKQDLPNTKILMIEPFLFPAPDFIKMRGRVSQMIDVYRKVAIKYADAYLPSDGLFVKEIINGGWEEYSRDGVHLTDKGNAVLANYVTEEIKKLIKE